MYFIDEELIEYVIKWYNPLINEKERAAQYYQRAVIEHGATAGKAELKNVFQMYVTNEKEVLKLLENGYHAFNRAMAIRILQENSKDVIVNNCPECGQLARTPYAKQCRYCELDWH